MKRESSPLVTGSLSLGASESVSWLFSGGARCCSAGLSLSGAGEAAVSG